MIRRATALSTYPYTPKLNTTRQHAQKPASAADRRLKNGPLPIITLITQELDDEIRSIPQAESTISSSPLVFLVRRSQQDVLMDAIRVIQDLEKCENDRLRAESIKSMSWFDLVFWLRNNIDGSHFIQAGVSAWNMQNLAYLPPPLSVMVAVLSFVRELKSKISKPEVVEGEDSEERVRREGSEEGEVLEDGVSSLMQVKDGASEVNGVSSETTVSGGRDSEVRLTLVEDTLLKIERWADRWLRGELDESDWNGMKGCLTP